MIKPIQLTAVLCLLCSSMTMAGTIIDIQNKNQLTTVLTDGQQVRVSMGEGEFVLVDHKSQQLMMVNTLKHEIMLFDGKQISASNNGPKVHTTVKLIGAGVNIAGYQTNKFEYFANGRHRQFVDNADCFRMGGPFGDFLLGVLQQLCFRDRARFGQLNVYDWHFTRVCVGSADRRS